MKRIGTLAIGFIILAVLLVYPLDTYISKPGGAYDLAPLVEVDGGDQDDAGTFSLMTISLGKATPASYVLAKFFDYRKLLPAKNVRRSDESEQEYNVRQKRLMSDSQVNAVTVAYEKAGYPYEFVFDGIFIMNVLEEGAADGVLEAGDKIIAVDGISLTESGQFFTMIEPKELGEEVEMSVERDGKSVEVALTMQEIPGGDGKIGLGIRFEEDWLLEMEPEVVFHTSNIGGPSAGLMFTLEIMDQLLEEDLTKGYEIAGTGEMLEDGTVGRIGGADFKVVAASRAGIEIFFAPDDDLPEEVRAKNPHVRTNYEEAVETAEKIGTKMKIVPVKNIDDALDYLDKLPPK